MLIQPSFRNITCFVCGDFNGTRKPVGTAFFFGLKIEGVGYPLLIVTALHVVSRIQQKSDNQKTFLRVNTKDGRYVDVEIEKDKWFKPDMSEEIIDIAFCSFENLPEGINYDFNYISEELAATAEVIEREQIGPGKEIAFPGLFYNHHGTQRNEPIVRFGNICAMPHESITTEMGEIEGYLVESRSMGGLSGSPVLVDVGIMQQVNNYRVFRNSIFPAQYLLGVISAHWNTPSSKYTTETDLSSETVNMGIAVVTPIHKILEVIKKSDDWRNLELLKKAVSEDRAVHVESSTPGVFTIKG